MSWRDVIGSVSAGTLGYIANGFRGAKAGFRGYNSYQKIMKRKAVSTSNFYGKAQKKSRTGKVVTTTTKTVRTNNKKPAKRRARLSSTKGCKPLSKCLRKQVRNIALNVVHKEHPRGRFNKHVLWTFPQVYGSGATPLQNVVNSLLYGGSTVSPDCLMCVGEYRKLVDAISVLFNGKAAGFYTSTGDIVTTQMIVPEITHTATYEFTNNTPHQQVFLMYEVVTKEDTDSTCYSNWNNMSVPQEGGTTRAVTYFGMRPEYYPQFKDAYTIKKKTFKVLQPGQRMVYTMKVNAKHLKFDSWTKSGSTTAWRFHKNFTKELMVINWAKPIVGRQSAGTLTVAEWNCSDVAGYGVVVQSSDYFTIRCPENISTANVKDNALCVFSQYTSLLDPAAVTTVLPKSISVVSPAQ